MSATPISLWPHGLVPLFGVAPNTRALIEYFIYGAALLAVSAVIFFWAAAARDPRRHLRRTRRRRSSHSGDSGKADHNGNPTGGRRRRSRSELQRNPTLAEIGGLPPRRDEPPGEPHSN